MHRDPKYSILLRFPMRERRKIRRRIDHGLPLFGDVVYHNPKSNYRAEEYHKKREQLLKEIENKPTPLQLAFQLLELDEKGATLKRAKKAYHKKCLKAHPDTGGTAEEFQQVKKAYELIVAHLSKD